MNVAVGLDLLSFYYLFLGSKNKSQPDRPLVYLNRKMNKEKYLEGQILKNKSLLGREKSSRKPIYKVVA